MARSFFGLSLRLGSRRSLSARGQRLHTFAGMGFSVAFSLLALGGYLIAQQFTNPIETKSLEFPFAALLFTTALTLFYCLLSPSRISSDERTELQSADYWEEKNVVVVTSGPPAQRSQDMPAQDRYVDRARICIRR